MPMAAPARPPAGSRLRAALAAALLGATVTGCQSAGASSAWSGSALGPIPAGPRIVFRHTGLDSHYGTVAVVALRDPSGPRTYLELACDRVYATATDASCLQTVRGSTTSYRLIETDASFRPTRTVALRGAPSRTRLSADGSLVASTVFVNGHSYVQRGFATATEIRATDGSEYDDLETFAVVLDGRPENPAGRNIWGVTFATDTTFYATLATGDRTYLMKGDIRTRTLTSLRQNAECPSVSPDRTRVAYKVLTSGIDPVKQWAPAVLDLTTGRQTVLSGERRSVDDQIEWLDGDTILYGLPRADQPGVDDVWALNTSATAAPRLFLRDAWSPAVVR